VSDPADAALRARRLPPAVRAAAAPLAAASAFGAWRAAPYAFWPSAYLVLAAMFFASLALFGRLHPWDGLSSKPASSAAVESPTDG
jgi:hypothetical protein